VEGREFFNEATMLGPAGWDDFVVEAVALAHPSDPVGEVFQFVCGG
jgi:hypothetical protein